MGDTFEEIAPGAASLALDDWRDRRARSTFRGRPLTDWSLGEAGRAVRSAEGWAAAVDSFGYDSGINLQNAGTAIPYLTGAGNPSGEARVPLEGMDRIPGVLAERFAAAGGKIRRSAEASRLELTAHGVRIRLAGGDSVDARRVVLALPLPALSRLASTSPVLDQPAHRRLFASVAGYPAMKLYVWFERPWWRVPGEAIINRLTTDLPIRKVFYLDEGPDRPAAMLAMFTDARLTLPWVELAGGASNGETVPKAMLAEVMDELRKAHPRARIPEPSGSALMHWGADPAEVGWHFWLAGANADQMMALAIQPDPDVPIHICGEVFSLEQAWAEGALRSASSVRDRLIG
jgi:monoamine oxidase